MSVVVGLVEDWLVSRCSVVHWRWTTCRCVGVRLAVAFGGWWFCYKQIFRQHEHIMATVLETKIITLYSRTYFCIMESFKVNSFAELVKLSLQSTLNFLRIFLQYGRSDYYKKNNTLDFFDQIA